MLDHISFPIIPTQNIIEIFVVCNHTLKTISPPPLSSMMGVWRSKTGIFFPSPEGENDPILVGVTLGYNTDIEAVYKKNPGPAPPPSGRMVLPEPVTLSTICSIRMHRLWGHSLRSLKQPNEHIFATFCGAGKELMKLNWRTDWPMSCLLSPASRSTSLLQLALILVGCQAPVCQASGRVWWVHVEIIVQESMFEVTQGQAAEGCWVCSCIAALV